MKRILIFKAEQFALFGGPVNVKAGVRRGKPVKAYTRVQKITNGEAPNSVPDAPRSPPAKHPVFGDYFTVKTLKPKRALHAVLDANRNVLTWSTSRKGVESEIEKRREDSAWANATVEKVTAKTAHGYKPSARIAAARLDRPAPPLPTPKGATSHKGTFYFPTHEAAKSYAMVRGYPTHRIIPYDKGHAIQGGESGDYAGPHGLKVGDWDGKTKP